MLYPTGAKYFSCDNFIGRLKDEIDLSRPYQTYTIFNPISLESREVAAMHLLPIDEVVAITKLNEVARELAEVQIGEQIKGGKGQKFRYWERAALAAQVLAYLTNRSVLLERSPKDETRWILYSDVDFEVALFILRFLEEPPPVKPEWWDRAAAIRRLRSKNFDDRPMLASISSKLHYYRLPGCAPALSDHPNVWATELNNRLTAAQSADDAAQEQLENDPLHQEDMRHAARYDFAQYLVDEEFGLDDYHAA